MIQMNLVTEQKQTHRLRERTYGCRQGQERREEVVGEFGMDTYTAIFKMDNQQVLPCSTGNSAQGFVAAWIGAESEGERVHACVWLSPFAVHLRWSQCCLLIDYTPI